MLWLLVFFVTPIAEMYTLIEVAGYIDVWPTIGLVMLTAVIGVALLKRQGVSTLTRGMGRLDRGEVPAREMAEGLLLAVAGALLLTPGFITDTVGFLLLFPPTRGWLARRMLNRVVMQHGAVGGGFRAGPGGPTQAPPGSTHEPTVIEGEFERKP